MKLKTLISQFLRHFLIKPFTFLVSLFFTKNKNTIAVFGRMGRVYADNPRYFFEEVFDQQGELNIEVYFFIRKKEKYNELKKQFGKHIVYSNSIRGLAMFAKSKTVVIGHGLDDTFPFILTNKRKNVINLFHAIPLKKVGLSVKYNDSKKIIKTNNNLSFFIVSSEEEKENISVDLGLNKSKIKVLGQPRNDSLINLKDNDRARLFQKEHQGYKVVLYAPTFRDDGRKVTLFPFEDIDLKILNEFLEKQNTRIIIRSHVNDFERFKASFNQDYQQIVFSGQDRYPDIQEILPFVDIVITDYSSVCLDFLLLDRPMIFFPYDLEQYSNERGFLFDYESATVGPKVSTQQEFIKTIETSLSNPELDGDERKKQCNRFHKFQDGQSTARIAKLIQEGIARNL